MHCLSDQKHSIYPLWNASTKLSVVTLYENHRNIKTNNTSNIVVLTVLSPLSPESKTEYIVNTRRAYLQ